MSGAVRAYVGLGANLGAPADAIADALTRLDRLDGSRLRQVSSLYRTAPVDADGPDFINAVAALDTTLDAATLLAALHAIEADAGRQRPYRNAPRLLDLDLLTWADAMIDTGPLRLPHPRMHLRAFVLVPLSEIAPSIRIPGQAPLATLLRACADQPITRVDAPAPPDAPRRTATA